jgi:hypothetical protein
MLSFLCLSLLAYAVEYINIPGLLAKTLDGFGFGFLQIPNFKMRYIMYVQVQVHFCINKSLLLLICNK